MCAKSYSSSVNPKICFLILCQCILRWVQSSLFCGCKDNFHNSLSLIYYFSYLSPCPTSFSGVSIEVLVEENQVLPVRVRGVARVVSMARPPPVLVRSKEIDDPVAELLADLQEVHLVPWPSWALHLQILSIVEVVPLKRLRQKKVN